VTGPSPITTPNARRRMTRVATSAPTIIPAPYMPSTMPTPDAD